MSSTRTTARIAKVAPEAQAMVDFEGVYKKLSGRQILENLSFSVRKGETFVIIGYSGTGKSVTLRHLVGLMQPDEGSIRVGGDEITTMTRKELELLRRKFGVLFQSGALIAWMDLFQNVELPLLEHARMSKRKRADVVREKLTLVNLWQDRDKFPSEISGGMKKRAGLARAIALDPEIVLYDEPSSGLDPVIAYEIDKLINSMRDKLGMTQIVVTHDMVSAYTIADRIGMFYHGGMAFIGTPDEIRRSNSEAVQHFITGGREGELSKRSKTAVMKGRAPTLSARIEAGQAAEAEEAEASYDIPIVLSEEAAAPDSSTATDQAPPPQGDAPHEEKP